MAEFFQLSTAERLDALNAVADISGLPPHLLEKDIWVVWSLHQLFTGPYAEHLVFKGGTSLSQAYGITIGNPSSWDHRSLTDLFSSVRRLRLCRTLCRTGAFSMGPRTAVSFLAHRSLPPGPSRSWPSNQDVMHQDLHQWGGLVLN